MSLKPLPSHVSEFEKQRQLTVCRRDREKKKRDSSDWFNRFGIHLSSNRSAKRYRSKLVIKRVRAEQKCRIGVRVCAIMRAYDACFSLNKFRVGFDTCCWASTTTSSFFHLFFFMLFEIALVGACARHRMNVINLLEILRCFWGQDLVDNHMVGIYVSLFSVNGTRTENFCSTCCVCHQMAVY